MKEGCVLCFWVEFTVLWVIDGGVLFSTFTGVLAIGGHQGGITSHSENTSAMIASTISIEGTH